MLQFSGMLLAWKIIVLLAGFVLLIKGADMLIKGASSLARKLKVPEIVIGLTIVAFGTSLPNLFVTVIAAIKGSGDLAVSSIAGSNTFNILFNLGIGALIAPLVIAKRTLWRQIPFSILALFIVYILIKDGALFTGGFGVLDNIDGLILLVLFAGFIAYVWRLTKTSRPEKIDTVAEILGVWKASALIVIGCLGLAFGGEWVVRGSVYIASSLGLSQALIGLTVVTIGTSLPELATTVVASLRDRDDLAIGNIIGSNTFNLLLILGAAAVARPFGYGGGDFDFWAVAAATAFLFFGGVISRKRTLGKAFGVASLALYAGYIWVVIAFSA